MSMLILLVYDKIICVACYEGSTFKSITPIDSTENNFISWRDCDCPIDQL